MPVTVSEEDYVHFVERAVRAMADIVADLGDEHACAKPRVPGANTAYGLLTHVLAVLEHWAGHVNLGRASSRDRAAEFAATGPVAELLARTDVALARFVDDVTNTDSLAPPRNPPRSWADRPEVRRTQGRVLLHVHEEVAQHLGQLEVLRDVLLDGRT